MRLRLPLVLMSIGVLLVAGSIGLTLYLFEYQGDNAGALFGVTVMPISVGLGILLISGGLILAFVRWMEGRFRL